MNSSLTLLNSTNGGKSTQPHIYTGMKTLHLWGANGRPSEISPESVALFWLINDAGTGWLSGETSDIELVFSNNTDLSPDGHLPLLVVSPEVKVSGFDSIVRYFQDAGSSSVAQLHQNALLEFVMHDLVPLTMYQLFLNKKNYTHFTRKQFSKLLYWPMWYNVPVNYRAAVREQCDKQLNLQYALVEEDPDYTPEGKDEPVTTAADLAQSKTFKLKAKSLLGKKDELHEAKHNMQYLTKLSEALREWYSIRYEELPRDTVIPADVLLWANIYIQLELPAGNKVREQLTRDLGAEKLAEITAAIDQLKDGESTLPSRQPLFSEQGNIIMSLVHKGAAYL